jgi:hypothetical protein
VSDCASGPDVAAVRNSELPAHTESARPTYTTGPGSRVARTFATSRSAAIDGPAEKTPVVTPTRRRKRTGCAVGEIGSVVRADAIVAKAPVRRTAPTMTKSARRRRARRPVPDDVRGEEAAEVVTDAYGALHARWPGDARRRTILCHTGPAICAMDKAQVARSADDR